MKRAAGAKKPPNRSGGCKLRLGRNQGAYVIVRAFATPVIVIVTPCV